MALSWNNVIGGGIPGSHGVIKGRTSTSGCLRFGRLNERLVKGARGSTCKEQHTEVPFWLSCDDAVGDSDQVQRNTGEAEQTRAQEMSKSHVTEIYLLRLTIISWRILRRSSLVFLMEVSTSWLCKHET